MTTNKVSSESLFYFQLIHVNNIWNIKTVFMQNGYRLQWYGIFPLFLIQYLAQLGLLVWLETEGLQVQASQASLRCVLEQEHNSYLSTGSTRKTCPYITEILLMGCKESNQTNKSINIVHFCKLPRTILVYVPAFRLLKAILAHRKKNNILTLLHAHNIGADNLVNCAQTDQHLWCSISGKSIC